MKRQLSREKKSKDVTCNPGTRRELVRPTARDCMMTTAMDTLKLSHSHQAGHTFQRALDVQSHVVQFRWILGAS